MTDIEIAWLAGLLEGEGCFHFSRTGMIQVSMTDKDVIERAAVLMGVQWRPIKRCIPGNKPVFIVRVTGPRALNIMTTILPFMGMRRTAKIHEVFAKCAVRPGQAYGERQGQSKLTDAQAEEIVKAFVKYKKGKGHESGVGKPNSGTALAKKYGVSHQTIRYTVNHRKNSYGERIQAP